MLNTEYICNEASRFHPKYIEFIEADYNENQQERSAEDEQTIKLTIYCKFCNVYSFFMASLSFSLDSLHGLRWLHMLFILAFLKSFPDFRLSIFV